ncbi:MAG: hypothetical protein ACK4V6_11030 [Microthrixaceae bacterium]
MTNRTDTRPPDWLNLDDVLAPEVRQRLEQHQRTMAETIISVRSVFEDAQATLGRADSTIGDLPEDAFDWIMANTVVGDVDKLARAFAATVAPDDSMTGSADQLNAELAKVPGLR